MELLGLALLMFLGRLTVDVIATVKGTTPPHIEKARLRAEQRRRDTERGKPARERSPYAAGKPTLRDVAAVLWGDAMADAIGSHDRRRGEKQRQRDENAQAAAEGRPASNMRPRWGERIKRFGKLLRDGPTPPAAATDAALADGVDAAEAVKNALHTDPVPTCDECGTCVGPDRKHPEGSSCPKASPADSRTATGTTTEGDIPGPRPTDAPPPPRRTTPLATPTAPRAPHAPDMTQRRGRLQQLLSLLDDTLQQRNWQGAEEVLGDLNAEYPAAFHDPNVGLVTHGLEPGTSQWLNLQTIRSWVNQYRNTTPSSATEGDTMTDPTTPTTGTATGDAHNVETALQQCQALDEDLVRIDTALDVIDEAIGSAGIAAERIQAFLASKNVDDSAVGGMAQASDMLSPEHIKALIDCVAAARAGVKAAEDELRRLQDLEQQLQGADGSILNGR